MTLGVDLSEFQSGLDISTLPPAGVKFAMLRTSWTGYGASRSLNEDEAFSDFYKQAKAQGLSVGAYHYSCADSYEQGRREAAFMYELIKDKALEYPVCLDVENEQWQSGASRKALTDACLGFCEYMQERHMYVAIYASTSWFEDKLDLDRLRGVDKWVADWGHNPPEIETLGIWQFGGDSTNYLRSSKIGGYVVDQNYSFRDYPTIMREHGLNGCSLDEPKQEPEAKPQPARTVYPPTITRGSESTLAVKIWQTIVGAEPDGIFGAETAGKTVVWQQAHDLDPDGIVGPLTWGAAFGLM